MLEYAAVLTDQRRRAFDLGPGFTASTRGALAVPQITLGRHLVRLILPRPLMTMVSVNLRRRLRVDRRFRLSILCRFLNNTYKG